MENEKLLIMSSFSFSYSFFKRIVLQTSKNQALFWERIKRVVNAVEDGENVVKGEELSLASMYLWFIYYLIWKFCCFDSLTLYHTILTFNNPQGKRLWKMLLEKEKMLETSFFSSHSVF